MAVLRRDKSPVATVGSRFEKTGSWASSWTVEAVLSPQGLPSHARLVETTTGRCMTVAVSVLGDPSRFTPQGKS
jgi:hypothetical protein